MNDIRVTHAALDTGAADISSAGQRIRQHLDDLHSGTADLRERFHGEARQAWDTAKHHWDQNMEDVDSILMLIESLVLRSRGNFADADRIAANNFGGNV
ncbi:WXG100 family type VII secretion target [Georgenia sp. Z1491]|uniref:WXG100 family type VII secretion target n=1 Tax=Georgenia sp. Z1491 TaxID=3416707 RepID=UPI003CFACF34